MCVSPVGDSSVVLVRPDRGSYVSEPSGLYAQTPAPRVTYEVFVRMKLNKRLTATILTAVVFLPCRVASGATTNKATDDTTLPTAVCQIVYPQDQFPSGDGYQYIFLGNGFFINEDGYLVTAAHLMSWFRNGGQPYILVGPPEGPRQILKATLLAADWDHDVAVLQATPNPFDGKSKISYLKLSAETPVKGQAVLSASFPPHECRRRAQPRCATAGLCAQ